MEMFIFDRSSGRYHWTDKMISTPSRKHPTCSPKDRLSTDTSVTFGRLIRSNLCSTFSGDISFALPEDASAYIFPELDGVVSSGFTNAEWRLRPAAGLI